jgi:hypothetical protein
MDISTLLNWEKWNLYNKNGFYNYKIYLSKVINGLPKNELLSGVINHPTLPAINLLADLNISRDFENSDFILVPHSWIYIKNNNNYLAYLHKLSQKVPILIINSGDRSPKCDLRNTLELRTFLHPWEKLVRKIVLPFPTVEKHFNLRKWKPKPTISFMGYVPRFGLGSLMGRNLHALSKPIKSSVYINRKMAIYNLKKLKSIFEVNLSIRSSYTAYSSNPNLHQLVNEYNLSLAESDYIVCPRGSANSTIRFYESLSAGRTPILINSDVTHPEIQEMVFWKSNIVNVELFENWVEPILSDWLKLGIENAYRDRQVENNKIFLNELQLEIYLKKLFQKYYISR